LGTIAPSIVAAIAVLAGVFVTFLLNRRMQIEAAWRTEKLSYYKELFDALAQNVEGMSTADTHRQFARASNNLLLVGSAGVLETHREYREHIALSNTSRDYSRDDYLLANLINAVRHDLKMPGGPLSIQDARLWTSRRKRQEFSLGDDKETQQPLA